MQSLPKHDWFASGARRRGPRRTSLPQRAALVVWPAVLAAVSLPPLPARVALAQQPEPDRVIRTTFARAVIDKSKLVKPLGIRKPERFSDIKAIINDLNSQLRSIDDPKDSRGIELEAIKRGFADILGEGDILFTILLRCGINFENLMNGKPVEENNPFVKDGKRIVYYTDPSLGNSIDLFDFVIIRQRNIIRAQRFGQTNKIADIGGYDAVKAAMDSVEGGIFYSTANGPDGIMFIKTRINPIKAVPSTYGDIIERALVPQNIFSDSNKRASLFDMLNIFYQEAIGSDGSYVYDDDFRALMKESLTGLKTWYLIQDSLLYNNREKVQENIDSFSINPNRRKLEELYERTKKYHACCTLGEYGPLLNPEIPKDATSSEYLLTHMQGFVNIVPAE